MGQKLHSDDARNPWFLEKCEDDIFWSHLLMSEEAHLYLDGFVNKQNCRIWATENPQAVKEHASWVCAAE